MTSQALTTAGPQAAALAEQYQTWTPDQVALIRAQLLQGKGTMDELSLLLHQAERTGLDPLSKQIYGIFRYDRNVGEKMTIQVGIDGFRAIAEKTGQLDGSEVFWCGKDGVWKDVWMGEGYPFAAKVVIYRKGCSKGFPAVARWDEYVQTGKGNKVSHMWNKMSTTMIAKCAEALALRKAFPLHLSGIYTDDEMSQAGDALNPLNEVHGGGGEEPQAANVTATPTGAAGEADPPPAATVTPTPDPTKVSSGVARREQVVELPPVDVVGIKTITKATKAKCAISGQPLGKKGDKFAYAQWNGGHWMAREDEYNKLIAQDAEFEEVPNEKVGEDTAEERVREAVKGQPIEKLIDNLVGPEGEEAPTVEDLDADLPN